tara:strand:- start:6008 stop:8605 length:2598 start_codon:yes stop_codon:yes gene_type:complete
MSDFLTDVDRQPIEWVEIDQSYCNETYGTGNCTASVGVTGSDKCFNTRKTCQDPTNYDQGIQTLRFTHNQARLPDDEYNFPYLQSAKISPAKINPGGSNRNSGAMGTRGTLSMAFSDHPHTDRIVDPYISDRSYDPFERSTFWAKWRSRNPYYNHRAVRYVSAFLDTDPDIPDIIAGSKTERTFFITGMSGPDSRGNVSMQAADVLTLALNDKAQWPEANTGKVSVAITDVSGSLTLTPSGVGDDEYPANGKIRIDNELITFTRASDVMTLTGRGVNNTTAAAHDANATVQLCVEYTAKAPDFILNDLLANGANIPATYLDTTQWATEVATHLPRLYSTIITEPTGVSDLINEISEQMYFTPWWDDKNALLKIRALRPAEDETITELNDDQHLLSDSITWKDNISDLQTRVVVYYALADYTKQLDDVANYSAIDVVADLESESETKNNTKKVKNVFSRWMTASDGAAAIDLGNKILDRYRSIPREVMFSVDAKDSALGITDFITVQNRNQVDDFGIVAPVSMQVISSSEVIQGTKFSYTALEYSGKTVDVEPDEFTVDIASDLLNLDLKALYDSKYAHVPVSGDKIRFTIRSNVTIGGTAFSSGTNLDPNVTSLLKTYVATYSPPIITDPNLTGVAPILQRKGLASTRTIAIGANYTAAIGGANYGALLGDISEVPLSDSLVTGTWAAGVELFLDIETGAKILGEGGSASFIQTGGATNLENVPGADGGNALNITHDITIDNLGIVSGGGGGGASPKGPIVNSISGGGGAGFDTSLSSTGNSTGIITLPSGGSKLNPGQGGAMPGIFTIHSGDGGALANNGWTIWGQFSASTQTGNTVGQAGAAIINGASMITWITKGDVRGVEV